MVVFIWWASAKVGCMCVCACMLRCFSCIWLIETLWTARLLCPWDSLGQNTGLACYSLLQGIFLTQGSNLGLPHCRQILYHVSHQRSFHTFTLEIQAMWLGVQEWYWWCYLVYYMYILFSLPDCEFWEHGLCLNTTICPRTQHMVSDQSTQI